MIVLAYDGSADADAALATAGRLFGREPVTVVTVWEPYVDIVVRSGAVHALPPPTTTLERLDAEALDHARRLAAAAATRLRRAGLVVQARAPARVVDVATTILSVADELDADAIVLGSRGLGGVRSELLGSVSHAVVHQADRAVVVIPSPGVADVRRAHRRTLVAERTGAPAPLSSDR